MPTRPLTSTRRAPRLNDAAWTGLLITDDGAPLEWPGPPFDAWVEVSGTFGTGGGLVIEGSATGTTWAPMSLNPSGAATFTAAGGGALAGSPRFIRPRVTGGDVTTNLAVRLSIMAHA